MTRRLVSGVLCFIGLTPISWTIKEQGNIEISSYSSPFFTGQLATEEAIELRYMLMSLGVPVKGPTKICGDNLGMIIYCANPDSEIKKKHVAISYHKLWESAAAGIVKPMKV